MDEKLLEGVKRDMITNLPYFDSFCMVAEKVLHEDKHKYHLVAFDVANFKLVNNNYGFREGDKLLNSVIKRCCIDDSSCVVATRTYSDHIVGLYVTDESECTISEKIAQNNRDIVRDTQEKFTLVPIHVHSGIYRIADNSEHITSCTDKANMARKAAKGNYNIGSMEYNDSLLKQHERVAEVITALEEGIRNKNILILLQPKINITTHKIVGAEALSRILDKNGNIIRPDEFIPVLEKTGKVVELDKYVMEYVMDLVEEWYLAGISNLTISINLSRIHFYTDSLAESIIESFEKRKIPPQLIEFEVTESVFLSDTDMIIDKINKLRDYGFKISIDDFGSGYSSFNLISILPVDVVKLDKGFIKTSLNTKRGKEIMRGLIKILNEIELEIICEGIENATEEKIVYDCGCNQVQGYLYDKPIKVDEFKNKYLKR